MSVLSPEVIAEVTAEYCDRHPSARARVKATKPGVGKIYLCGHCGSTQAQALANQGFNLLAVAHTTEA